MGNASSSEGEAKTPSLTESHKSARNVLEKFALEIKNKASDDAKKYRSSLKGELKGAKFYHPFSEHRPYYTGPCELEYEYHSNIWNGLKEYRHPCAGRNKTRFSNESEEECNSSKITGNKTEHGACAPYRRRELCDYIFHQVNPVHIKNSHDLLGNLLVTAKYEGESIVKNHPNKTSSDLCTALARSFADIGDIIRGKDLYLGNGDYKVKLSNNLREIFKNIYADLDVKVKETYKGDENYYKLREHWWTANRDQVWKAITCDAPRDAHYFIKSSANKQSFSNSKCGHHNNDDPLTNLDYVPQFLRWFNEWSEEFCRIKKIKLENVKNACRDERRGKYCSLNGFDCTQTIWKKKVFGRGNDCTNCSFKCFPYEIWLGNQREAFRKQKEKYAKEINGNNLLRNNTNNSINNKYNKDFYKLLEKDYKTVNKFIKLLNEGKYCKKNLEKEEDITFTNIGEKGTFYRSDYCQVCPDCGVECKNETCKPKEKKYPECLNKEIYTPNGAETTEINVINSGDKQVGITEKLSEFCTDSSNNKGKNYENWQCYYKNGDDNKCKMVKNSGNNITEEKIISFDEFFYVWVRKLLIDSIKWENELNNCIDNTSTHCNKECNKNCKCFQSWVDKKEIEWKNVKNVFENKNGTSHNYYNKLNGLFKGFFF
ncbi:hypothetical protein PFMALIP_05885 [Plasmodium falciparum MaliPS096_E11]|uniref:Plasmodium falciparum erythrocyte membrane protein-1 N-terminal segment domain-containing protein n=3 Tax=Plasmodium falciparum MaliPS096_E11 TaxID=1036727 RepID=A0A024WHQ0_PLAFA|nr:hypothetical protein PFMALIP_05885 [Plasmodium falciparum MaliPS096_E11]